MEETIERIVGFFRHAAQGLEERKQVLYLLGPVGGGKSSLGERLKALMEKEPIYVLKAGSELSPVFESPLGLFDPDTMADTLLESLRHSAPRADRHRQPLGAEAAGGGRRRPAELPGRQALPVPPQAGRDRQNRAWVTTTIRTSRLLSARSISESSRATARTTRTPTASQAASTGRTRGFSNSSRCSRRRSRCFIRCSPRRRRATISAPRTSARSPSRASSSPIPTRRSGQTFRNNRTNEAFLDRVSVVKVPYCLRVTEESKIYHKLISGSALWPMPPARRIRWRCWPASPYCRASSRTRTPSPSPRCASMMGKTSGKPTPR